MVGKKNLIFTNVNSDKLNNMGEVHKGSVKKMKLKNACILDPFAQKCLSSKDKFDYLILGGILGDEPMQRRTEKELDIPGERRNLGQEQMSTDTAVYVAKHIVQGGSMSDLKFQDEIEIDIQEGESFILPFRYVLIDGKPLLPEGMIEFLKKKGF